MSISKSNGKKPPSHSRLKSYTAKRNLSQSPEPEPTIDPKPKGETYRFVVHKHAATRLHYDLRIECDGVLLSWAIPKGPSLDPLEKRLAVRVEDHPLHYQSFEGVIPKGNYGAGTMMVWDLGTYTVYEQLPRETHEETFHRQYKKGSLKIDLSGQKLLGRFALVKIKKSEGNDWLLIKKHDAHARHKPDVHDQDLSVQSGRSMSEIASAAKPKLKREKLKTSALGIGKADHLIKALRKSSRPQKWSAMQPIKAPCPSKDGYLTEGIPRGIPSLAFVDDNHTEIITLKGLKLTARTIEIANALSDLPGSCVVMGIVAMDKKPHLFHVSDILWLKGCSLVNLPLASRLAIRDAIAWKEPIRILKSDPAGSIQWHRRLDGTYELGGKSPTWCESSSSTTANSPVRSIATNPTKVYFPKDGFTKADVQAYYKDIAPLILPHLKDRPQSMHRHPNGIAQPGFFQKEALGSVPGWIATTAIRSSTKTINYLLCQDLDTLLYMANLGCIEINPWLSRLSNLASPDFAVVDIDPGTRPIEDTIDVAQRVRSILEEIGAQGFCKTSGSRGLHIYVPTDGKAGFAECQVFASQIGFLLKNQLPTLVSCERSPLVRRDKIYIDSLQNRRGQTMASVYSLRPRDGAPVSTPITWRELNKKLNPSQFNLKSIGARLERRGDLWEKILMTNNNISQLNTQLGLLLTKIEQKKGI